MAFITTNGANGNGSAAVAAVPNGVVLESSEPVDKRKLFVGGLSTDTTEDDLKEYFEKIGGPVAHAMVKRDPASGRSRCFAFVTMGDSASVKKVCEAPSHYLKGKKIDPKPAEPRPGEEVILKIFVGGIDTAMSEEELKGHFEKFGTVKNIEWPKDRLRDNAKKNFAFIEFEEERVVNEIIKNAKMSIGSRVCDVRKAIPSAQKQAQAPGAGGWGDYGSPYGSYGAGYGQYPGAGGYGAAGAYGDQYAGYYGQGYDQSGYYGGEAAAGGYYPGYEQAYAGYDYSGAAAGYGAAAYGQEAAAADPYAGGYMGGRGGAMRGAPRGRGAPMGVPRGAKPGGIAGAGARGAPRGFHPYRRV